VGHLPGHQRRGRRYAFFVLVDRSWIDFGPGILTALSGLMITICGVLALRRAGTRPLRAVALMLAGFVLLTVAAFVLRMYVFPEFLLYGPKVGVYAVVVGAVVGIAGSVRNWPHARPCLS
jgi:hypothetical protein